MAGLGRHLTPGAPLRPSLRLLVPLVLWIAAGWSVPAAAQLIPEIFWGGSYAAEVWEDPVDALFVVYELPFRDAHTASDGSTTVTTTYDLTSSGFEILMDHTLGPMDSIAASYGGLRFAVDAPVVYRLEGGYYASNETGTWVTQEVELENRTLRNTTLEQQWPFVGALGSNSTADISLELGGMPVDENDILFGSTTGTLLPGYEYELQWDYAVYHTDNTAATGATAEGFFRLTLIPEPSTALLLGLGLAVLAAGRRRSANR
jgi:hypothetical protein